MRPIIFSLIGLFVASAAFAAQPAPDAPHVVGWVEEVAIENVGLVLKAKMDTGAKTSSIDAEIIDIRKEGKKKKGYTGEVVIFSVTDAKVSKTNTFERKIVRYVRIKKKSGGYLRRPVIVMQFCVAGKSVKEEVNLANRENFIYPVLVGRNMMQHVGIAIDPGRTLLSNPHCTAKE